MLEYLCLGYFIASSYEALRRVWKLIEEFIFNFREKERRKLTKGIRLKKTTVEKDETVYSGTCLVSMQMVSSFILLAQYVLVTYSKDIVSGDETVTKEMNAEISKMLVIWGTKTYWVY